MKRSAKGNNKNATGKEASASPSAAASAADPQQQPRQSKLATMEEQLTTLYNDYMTVETLQPIKIPLAVLLMALLWTGNIHLVFHVVIYPLYWTCLRIIAITIGVAFGLGFAMHVYDQFDDWTRMNRLSNQDGGLVNINHYPNNNQTKRRSSLQEQTQALLLERLNASSNPQLLGDDSQQESSDKVPLSGRQLTKVAPTTTTAGGGGKLVWDPHDTSYAALMASAGYEVDPNWKRGQVVRDPLPKAYKFCDDRPVEEQYAIHCMRQEWPTLPVPIHKSLGMFMEFIMRDYVSTWYSMIDQGIKYPPTVQRAKDKAACLERGDVWKEPPREYYYPPIKPHTFPRRMVLSTSSTRSLPMLEIMYRSLSVIFGNLAHRVQDVNLFQLLLLKWVKVIAHTFKVYRQLRKSLLEKQNVHKLALFEEARQGVGRAILRKTVNTVKNTASAGAGLASAGVNTVKSTASAVTGGGGGGGGASASGSISISIDNLNPMTTTEQLLNAAAAAATTMETTTTADNNNNSNATTSGASSTSETPAEAAAAAAGLDSSAYQPVSEMALAREFLVTGKLHPAVTFGLEIPSLLFADATGQDCGTGVYDSDDDNDDAKHDDDDGENDKEDTTMDSSEQQQNSNQTVRSNKRKKKKKDEDQVLEERLFKTRLLFECELDYNRVMASRYVQYSIFVYNQDICFCLILLFVLSES